MPGKNKSFSSQCQMKRSKLDQTLRGRGHHLFILAAARSPAANKIP